MVPKLFILAAASYELDPFRPLFEEEKGILLCEVGVGAVSAALGTYDLLSSFKKRLSENGSDDTPPKVLFVGSVGCSDSSVPLLSLVSATEVKWTDASLAAGASFLPEAAAEHYAADEKMLLVLRQSLVCDCLFEPVLTTPSITAGEKTAESLGRLSGARFENLELFGIAASCARLGVPWASLSSVTNHILPAGHDQWLENRGRAALLSAAAACRFCANLPK